MITVVTDKKLIEKYQSQLDKSFTKKVNCWIGYHGGSWQDTVSFAPNLNMWTCNFEYKDKRVNLFGIGEPIENKLVSMTGQINFPFEAINRRVAGAFAIDDEKKILILHRGKIGGGKPGIGKNLFVDNFRGEFITAIDNGRDTKFCFVGELESPFLSRQISDFIGEIARIKTIEDNSINSDFDLVPDFCYTDEHSGLIVTEKNEPTIINRTHGIVVNALSRELMNKGFLIGNDKNRDLFIHKNKTLSAIFEIKTSSSTQNIYSAVGQLLIYSIPFINKIDLIAVLPVKLNKQVENRLKELNIIPLYYIWDNDRPVFQGLDKILNQLAAPNKR